jgi:hypothetical protein
MNVRTSLEFEREHEDGYRKPRTASTRRTVNASNLRLQLRRSVVFL